MDKSWEIIGNYKKVHNEVRVEVLVIKKILAVLTIQSKKLSVKYWRNNLHNQRQTKSDDCEYLLKLIIILKCLWCKYNKFY